MIRRSVLFATILISVSNLCLAQNLDVSILKRINPNGHYSPVVRSLSNSAYSIGIGLPLAISLAGEIAGNKDFRAKGLRITSTVLASAVLTELVKRQAARNRPGYTYKGIIFPYKKGNDQKSLPSGHTSLAFATATSISLEFNKWYVTVPAFAWASAVGYSRMYLGAHYPSDVLAGAAVGTGSALLCHWLNKKLFSQRQPAKLFIY